MVLCAFGADDFQHAGVVHGVPGGGCRQNVGVGQVDLFDRFDVVVHAWPDGHEMFFVKTQIPISDEFYLLVDYERSDDQERGNGKLETHQPLSKAGAAVGSVEIALEHFNWLEGGEEQSWITSRQQTDKEGDANGARQ